MTDVVIKSVIRQFREKKMLMNPLLSPRCGQDLRVVVAEGENNNPKWTLADMEKYMLGEEETTMALGLMPRHLKHGSSETRSPKETESKSQKGKLERVDTVTEQVEPTQQQHNGNVHESAGEESSPSWASSSAGDTPSYGSVGTAFEFDKPKVADYADKLKTSATAPVITTTTCTPTSTPVNPRQRHLKTKTCLPKEPKCSLDPSLTKDLLEALDSDQDERHDWFFKRKSRKGSSGSVQDCSGSNSGTPSKGSRLSRLLRRTHSAGCSKEIPPHNSYNMSKVPVTKAKSADGAPCCREDEDVKKKNRKTLAQDMKMRLSFLRRRHTDSSLQPSSVRPSPEEAHKWAESFNELTNSKYGLSLFRAFLSREFSEENIEFWLACEDFKRTRGNKLSSKARKIYDDFVAVQSPKEVNLDSNMRTAIQDRLNNPERHAFDSAQRRIQGLMEQDAYIRFLQSDLYTELLQCSQDMSR